VAVVLLYSEPPWTEPPPMCGLWPPMAGEVLPVKLGWRGDGAESSDMVL
jgi:hypothetical protein